MKIQDNRTENRILKAALKQFGSKGFDRATVDSIARVAGIAKGTIYLYFKNKEAIYAGACVQQFDRLMEGMTAEISAAGSAEQKLTGIAQYLSSYIVKIRSSLPFFDIENIHLTAQTLKSLHSVVMPKMIKMNRIIAEVISLGIKDREFRELDPQIAAFCFISLMRAMFMNMMFKFDTAENADDIMRIFLCGIKRR